MKNRKFIAILLVLALAICVFPAAAFAEPITSEQPDQSFVDEYGWFEPDGYSFLIMGTKYYIPHGTVCSKTCNNTVYKYVYPVQFILFDFSEYYENMGYYPGVVDGIFGDNTKEAVKYYQGRKGLQVDGDVGDNTWSSFVNQWVFG